MIIVVFILLCGAIVFCVQRKKYIKIRKQQRDSEGDIVEQLRQEKWQLKDEISKLNKEIESNENRLEVLEQEYQQKKDKLKDAFVLASEQNNYALQNLSEKFNQDYKEIETQFNQNVAALSDKKEKLQAQIEDLRAIAFAATETNRRLLEENTKRDFYRLQLSQLDVEDIKKLREIESNLHNPDVLNKLIYKTYYENAYNSLIGRVFSEKKNICGIYKITEISTGRAYVGQSTDVPERWRQHIKRGVGAETPTRNKLYPAMKEVGAENFTFELIEECSKDKLDKREDFWQDFYQVKDFGFSIK